MKKSILKKLSLLTVFLLLFTFLFACTPADSGAEDVFDTESGSAISQTAPDPDGSYTSAEDVSAYLIAYGRLPENFIAKKKPGIWAGKAALWSLMRLACASAAINSEIMREICRKKTEEPIMNAISTHLEQTDAVPSVSSFLMTA